MGLNYETKIQRLPARRRRLHRLLLGQLRTRLPQPRDIKIRMVPPHGRDDASQPRRKVRREYPPNPASGAGRIRRREFDGQKPDCHCRRSWRKSKRPYVNVKREHRLISVLSLPIYDFFVCPPAAAVDCLRRQVQRCTHLRVALAPHVALDDARRLVCWQLER